MQRYWWPGYEMQLLRALQRQQNSAQFCDTLLQTEGISVPTHSCVLAALSPYLFQKLSASPPPPSGQKRQLQLEAVKSHTLLKLVGLLYSGELEVKEGSEQNDILAVAHQFGITDLAEGVKIWGLKDGELQEKSLGSCRENIIHAESNERDESRTMQDVQVQAGNRSYVSTGTQTAVETSEDSSAKGSGQAPTPESESSDGSAMLQPLNITLDEQLCSTSCSFISSLPTGAPNDRESTLNRSSGRIINPKSTLALSRNVMTFPLSLNDDADCPSNNQQSAEFGDNIHTLSKKRTGQEGGKINDNIADNTEDSEQPDQASKDEISRDEIGKSPERKHECANAVMKSLSKMQQMLETTQISMKVKLRRGANGRGWKVVSLQDLDETLLVTSHKQDGSKQKKPQTAHTCIQPPAGTTKVCTIHKPETVILLPATTGSPNTPPQPSISNDSFTPNQSNAPEAALLPQPQSSVEESDEQIEKLLEDIMMGLNILPNLERDCKKSDLQPSHDGVKSTCQVPITQSDAGHSQMGAAVSATGFVFCQELGTQSGNSSTDTGTPCFTPQNQPYSRVSSVQLFQQQQCSSQYHSSVRSMPYKDGLSCQNMPLTKSQQCLQPEVPVTRSVMPSAFFSAGQKLHYQAFQEPASQGNQHILELLPPMTGNESLHTLFLPCMDDLRLPPCLSPIEQYTSATKHQAPLNNRVHNPSKFQPSRHGRPWLTENPGLLQFPLSAIIRRKNKSTSLPQDTNFWTKHLELNAQKGGIWPETCTLKEMEGRGTICVGQQNAAELTSDPKEEESLKCEQGDTIRDTMESKRKRRNTGYPQDAACSLLTYKDKKICDGTKGEINLSVCSVSLSSNNVLAKEREMATNSSNIIPRIAGKPSLSSSTTESLRENTKRSRVNAVRTRIRTKGILRRTQKSPSNTTAENSLFPKPVACTAEIVNEVITPPRRKPGRPRKKFLSVTQPESISAVTEKNNSANNQQQMNEDDLYKEDKTKRRCKKRRRNLSTEVEVIPLKRTISTESTDKAITDNNIIPTVSKLKAPKQSLTVTLEDFHKIIRLQHSKTGKSKSLTKEPGRDAESEGIVSGDSTFRESTKETKTDIIQPEDMGGSEESPVIITVMVDKNHNKIFNKEEMDKSQQDDTDSSTSKEPSMCTDDLVLPFDEEMTKLAAKRDPPLKDPDEVQKSWAAGVSDTTQQAATNNGHLSRCDSDLSQEDKLASVHNPEATGPPQLGTGGICRTSGCTQEEEEEVDVLLYSPDKVSQSRQWTGLDNMEITLDEEEEEDVYEVDVTGDEAE